MKTIWKFELENHGNQKIEMPIGAKILDVQAQDEKPCIWALVDPEEEKETRSFKLLFAGEFIYFDKVFELNHLGTCQINDESIVIHVFEDLIK